MVNSHMNNKFSSIILDFHCNTSQGPLFRCCFKTMVGCGVSNCTVTVPFVQETYVQATFVHIGIISAVTDFFFGTFFHTKSFFLAWACGVPSVVVLLANDVVAIIFISLFFFLSFFFLFFPRFFFPFPPSLPFLIEGVVGSKNLFSESCLERPKT